MKPFFYIFALCTIFNYSTTYSQNPFHIDYEGYLMQYEGDSLFQKGQYNQALKIYLKALKSDIFFKPDVKFKMAYCYAVLKEDSLAKTTIIEAYNDGFKQYFEEGIKQDWLLNSLKTDSNYTAIYKQIIKENKNHIYSDSLAKYPAIRDSLNELFKLDQKYRKIVGGTSDSIWNIQQQIDIQNQEYVKNLLNKFKKLPDYKCIGGDALHNLMIIVVHSENRAFQKKLIKLAGKSVKKYMGVSSMDYALLVDKYCVAKYGCQIFGTQIKSYDEKNDKLISTPIFEQVSPFVDKLREEFNLQSLEEYKRDMKRYSKNKKNN